MNEIMTTARDAMTVRRVSGDPVTQDGVSVISAAMVIGGVGGGSGRRGDGEAADGGGSGVIAVPVGVYEIRDGQVRWHPAVNVNLLTIAAAPVAVTHLLTRTRTARARIKAARG
jgi:uncharacterized spore protein YtfJ